MIEFLQSLDDQAFLLLNGPHSEFFDDFMKTFTGRFVWVPMYLAIAFMMFRVSHTRKFILYIAFAAIAVTITDQLCGSVIRPAVERFRPSNLMNEISQFAYIVDGYRGGSYGFPSCHAANSFALAVFAAMMVRRRGFTIFLLGWAALNCYTRLYLGVHYPGDLLVGAIIGSATGCLCFLTAKRLIDPKLSRREMTERAHQPFIAYNIPVVQNYSLLFVNSFTLSGQGLVKFVGTLTILFIAAKAIL